MVVIDKLLLGEAKQVIMLQNIRLLTKNFDELTLEIASLKEKPMAICLTETRLKNNFSSNIFHIDGYDELVTSNREKEVEVLQFLYKKNLMLKYVGL